MKSLIVFTMLFAIVNVVSAQQFSGRVSDTKGNPLIGANVYFEDSYSGTITDTNGEFSIRNIRPGSYTVIVSYMGYETLAKDIQISADIQMNFSLERAAYLVDEVIVRGLRAGFNDPVTRDNISAEEIEKQNFGRDIPLLLKYTPSLVSSSDAGNGVGYTGFRIRGTDANRINITVDGIPLNDAESHGVWWVNMPDFASSVENIQIQRGVGTSTNGSAAFGASVNFQTSSLREKAYASVNTGYGSFNTLRNSLSVGTGLINDHYTLDLRLSDLHSDGYIDRAETDLQSLFLTAARYSEKSIIKFNMILGKEKTYQAWDGVPGELLGSDRTYNGTGMYTDSSGKVRFYENETDNYRQNHYHLHFSRELGRGFWFNTTLHYTQGAGYYEQYKEDQSFASYGLSDLNISDSLISSSDLIRQKWLDNDFYGLVLSFNLKRSQYELNFGGGANQYLGDHFGEIIWSRFAGSSEKGQPWYEGTGNKRDYNFFTKVNYSILNNLQVYGDLQVRGIDYEIEGIDDNLRDISQTHNFLFFNPKAGINYRPDNRQRLYLSMAAANREPNRSNYVDADPLQPLPVHETLFNYELGYEYSRNTIEALLNLYVMDYDNQLVLTGEINDVGDPVMTNVKDSYRIGAELSAAFRLHPSLSMGGNIGISRNRIQNMVSYVDNWDYWSDPENLEIQIREESGETEIAFSPSVVTSGNLTWQPIKGMEISFQSKYVGKQYIDNTQSESRKLDPWFTSDLLINYSVPVKMLSALELRFMLINLTDHTYESNAWVYRYYSGGEEQLMTGYYPQAGIHFMTGLVLQF